MLCVVALGCDSGGPVDAGRDAAPPDSGERDAQVIDAGVSDAAVGPNPFCGRDLSQYVVIRDGGGDLIPVDTRGLGNGVGMACGLPASGEEGFLALEARAGERWSIELLANETRERDPILYVLDGSCDPRRCDNFVDDCGAEAAFEELTINIPSDGVYFIGADDGLAGGAQYVVRAIRIRCGDGVREGGEACDSIDGCNDQCQLELTPALGTEMEPNESFTMANALVLEGGVIAISGELRASGCRDRDVFRIDVPEGGATLSISEWAGTEACEAALVRDFVLTLENTSQEVVATAVPDVDGCLRLEGEALSAGTYFFELSHRDPLDASIPYAFRVSLSP